MQTLKQRFAFFGAADLVETRLFVAVFTKINTPDLSIGFSFSHKFLRQFA